MRLTLIIFLKAPVMGKAKTRLAADIGKVHAWRLYRAMTATLLRRLQSPKWDLVLAVTPPKSLGRVPLWWGHHQYAQVSGSLSPRLAQAFSRKGKTIVIGSDSPQVTRADIDRAFKAMRCAAPVFGPADDGGFWLIGAHGPLEPSVFANVRWSSKHALADMKSNIGQTQDLRVLTDIDNLAALKAVRQSGRFVI